MLTAQRDGSVPGASHSVVRQENGMKRVSPAGTGQGGRIPPLDGAERPAQTVFVHPEEALCFEFWEIYIAIFQKTLEIP